MHCPVALSQPHPHPMQSGPLLVQAMAAHATAAQSGGVIVQVSAEQQPLGAHCSSLVQFSARDVAPQSSATVTMRRHDKATEEDKVRAMVFDLRRG